MALGKTALCGKHSSDRRCEVTGSEGYRGVWEWEMGRVCFRFLVRGFSFSRCHSYSKAGAGAKAEASDMLLVWHLRVIN